jgi:quercetin dioxygenase-like cupin family protein
LTAALLVVGGGLAQAQQMSPPPGIERTEVQRHDFQDTQHEAVQVRVDFAPGAGFPKHTHPGVEIAYVIEGTVEYQVGNQAPVILKAGQSLYLPEGTPHSAKNIGTTKASELATYLLEKGKPVVVLTE